MNKQDQQRETQLNNQLRTMLDIDNYSIAQRRIAQQEFCDLHNKTATEKRILVAMREKFK